MLLSKEAVIVLNVENVDRFESLGYEIPRYYNKQRNKYVIKRGTTITVKVEDLARTSHALVEVMCNYCLTIKQIQYVYYSRAMESDNIIQKYCCVNCQFLKKKEINEYKQERNLLKKGDKSYWTFKENRLKELDLYLKKYGTICNMQKDKVGCVISSSINNYGEESIEDCCIELGYKLEDVKIRYKPENYYDNLENLKYEIEKLCKILGRFPKQIEVLKHLHINNNYLLAHGGIREIKRVMNYCDSNDLIDDRGYPNLSVYEYMVAQYLIANNIPYKREVYPFTGKHSRLRSDFTFYLENDKQIHVEVWGFPNKDSIHKREQAYYKKRMKKESLYKKYNYTHIGIDYEVFQGKYEEIISKLFSIFSPYLNLKYKFVEQLLIIPPSKCSDDELLNEIMKYSDDKSLFPKQSTLQVNGATGLYLEAIKRYGSYFNFAKKYGKNTYYQCNKWDSKDAVFDVFQHMIGKYGHLLSNEEIKKNKHDKDLTGIIENSVKLFGSFMDARLLFYEYYIDLGNSMLSEIDMKYLKGLVNLSRGFNRKFATEDRREKAKAIISRLNNVFTEVN